MNDETPMHPKFRRRRNNLLAARQIEGRKPMTESELFAREARYRTVRIMFRSLAVLVLVVTSLYAFYAMTFHVMMWLTKTELVDLLGG